MQASIKGPQEDSGVSFFIFFFLVNIFKLPKFHRNSLMGGFMTLYSPEYLEETQDPVVLSERSLVLTIPKLPQCS